MTELISVISIIAALALGTVSPGPSFIVVARVAISASRAQALGVALGMGLGSVAFAIAALLGLHGLLLAVPTLYLGLKILGGLYLCYLGLGILRSARKGRVMPETESPPVPTNRSTSGFGLGLVTHLSNPKTAVVYASVFAAFLPPTITWTFSTLLVVLVFCLEAGWYSVVALTLSASRPRGAYLAWKAWIDRTAGAVMLALGLKLISEATHRP